jgi:NADH dehydrogenase
VVRSERARATLVEHFGDSVDIRVVDYRDASTLSEVIEEGDVIVHLVGIIKETSANTYEDAHERACQALVSAADARQAKTILVLGILGSDAASTNACLASRGRAEDILLAGSTPASIIRVPMVLGEDDYAAMALARQARSRFVLSFRKGSLEQPIYAGDVAEALLMAIEGEASRGIIELAGPESLTREALILRAGACTGNRPRVISLPISMGLMVAALMERMITPPVTRAMLGVLDHDDRIDPMPAAELIGITLTSLDETLRRVIH